ncbi:unnamed protein product [Clonostachys rosea]|uniref:UBC core domain-containing protein n=1 Tax=Bionectria ochroleuca TaxID=29856 RepID=A0ABY6V2L9_BIOOC|nr:unnamed protein product [Clonostachys rosea]
MASQTAVKRLNREYLTIQANPPPYITAHPSQSNILEWHYVLTGPENTPYHNGQYWGTLVFPPNYPFAPPAIRMKTPSGRFQPSTRLCLSISDFHPRSFNPAWEVSTILNALLSFMTGDDITTGSINASRVEREHLAFRSRWWNSTSDDGKQFRSEWPELDVENREWMKQNNVDLATGHRIGGEKESSCGPQLSVNGSSGNQTQAVVDAVVQQRDAGRGWVYRHKLLIAGGVIFIYVLIARLLSGEAGFS